MNKIEFIKDVSDILNTGKVENINLNNLDILKNVMLDEDIKKHLYENFENNYNMNFDDEDDLYLKTNDFVYRLHLLVDLLTDKYNFDFDAYRNIIFSLVENNDVDLYSAVNYNEDDIEIIDNMYDEILNSFERFKI